MCRIAAYLGPACALGDVILMPPHSLLHQSQAATEAKLAVNGDGFGMAWYSEHQPEGAEPGLYRDVLPAWSDGNLPSLCRVIRSPLFLAHVRAGTDGETARVNCHPFTFGRWSFVHNGRIRNFSAARRQLEAELPDRCYQMRRGMTDSELFFLLMVALGLEQDPLAAFQDAMARVQSTVEGPHRFAVAVSDGVRIWAFRSSCDAKSPTLYTHRRLGGGTILASEPLDGATETWQRVPENSCVTVDATDVVCSPLVQVPALTA